MRDFLENVATAVLGGLVVLFFCAVYWIARLFGVELEEDF